MHVPIGGMILKKFIFIAFLTTIILCGCGREPQDKNSSILEPAKINDSKTENSNDISNSAIIEKTTETNLINDRIVLYHGITLNSEDENIDIYESADSVQKEKIIKKYEREYLIYSDGKLLGKAIGKTEGRGLDYYWDVSFDTDYGYEIAVAGIDNPYPREIKDIKADFPIEFRENGRVLNEVNSQFNVDSRTNELIIVDIDGDGLNEYMALFLDKKNYFFAKCLIDSNFKILSYLTVLKEHEDEFVEWEKLFSHYNLHDSGEIIDINSDGIMEIILDFPTYEGFDFKIFTYKDGKFNGEFINMSSLQP